MPGVEGNAALPWSVKKRAAWLTSPVPVMRDGFGVRYRDGESW
jgi:hypothetical protein